MGNDGCLRTLGGIDIIIFSGANALAGNIFRITGVVPTTKCRGRRMLRCTTRTRDCSGRPVTGSVLTACKGPVSRGRFSSFRRVSKRNVDIVIRKGGVLTNGDGLVRSRGVTCTTYSTTKAGFCMTTSNDCMNYVLVTSRIGPSDGYTVTRLGGVNIRGAIVLANSSRQVNGSITSRLNLSTCCTRLLPSRGIRGLRVLSGRGQRNDGLTFINSNVGSTPILTHTSINVTVKNLNSSTTVRTTSIILVASRPSGLMRTVSITGTAGQVIVRGVIVTLNVGDIFLILNTLNVTNV